MVYTSRCTYPETRPLDIHPPNPNAKDSVCILRAKGGLGRRPGLTLLAEEPQAPSHACRAAWGTGSLSSKLIYNRAPFPTPTPLDSDEGKSQPPSRRKWRGALSCRDGGTASGEQWGWARGVGRVPWQPCHRHKPHYLAVPQAASLLTQGSSRLRR